MRVPEFTSLIGAAAAKYGATAAGLAVGTAARYGLAIKAGRRFGPKDVVADLLLQGVLALIAVFITEQLHLTGDYQALVAALVALNSERLVKLARDHFFGRVEAAVPVTEQPGAIDPAIGGEG